MGAQIKNAKGSIGLHDLKLLGIFEEKVTVSEEKVCHQTCLAEVTSACRGINFSMPVSLEASLVSVVTSVFRVFGSSSKTCCQSKPASTLSDEPWSLHELTSTWGA